MFTFFIPILHVENMCLRSWHFRRSRVSTGQRARGASSSRRSRAPCRCSRLWTPPLASTCSSSAPSSSAPLGSPPARAARASAPARRQPRVAPQRRTHQLRLGLREPQRLVHQLQLLECRRRGWSSNMGRSGGLVCPRRAQVPTTRWALTRRRSTWRSSALRPRAPRWPPRRNECCLSCHISVRPAFTCLTCFLGTCLHRSSWLFQLIPCL